MTSARLDPRLWLSGKRACGYLRVSDKRQADKFGPSSQKRVELERAEEHDVIAPTRFYEDHISGRDALKRSDFQRMVADARSRAFDVLLVGRVDRFARNERDAWNYLHSLAEVGAAVYFCEEDVLVPHDDGWQDRIGSEINAAAAYSRRLSKNIRHGFEAKRAAGGYVGGLAWGYRLSDDKMRPVPSEDLALRLEVWNLYAMGNHTDASVAEELNRRGSAFSGACSRSLRSTRSSHATSTSGGAALTAPHMSACARSALVG